MNLLSAPALLQHTSFISKLENTQRVQTSEKANKNLPGFRALPYGCHSSQVKLGLCLTTVMILRCDFNKQNMFVFPVILFTNAEADERINLLLFASDRTRIINIR